MLTEIPLLLADLGAAPLWTIAASALTATAAWFANERSKAKAAQIERKELAYKELLDSLPGFLEGGASDPAKIERFLRNFDLCWLYAPDSVIRAGYNFIDSVHTGKSRPYSDEERMELSGRLVFEIRRDILDRSLVTSTVLDPKMWKVLSARR